MTAAIAPTYLQYRLRLCSPAIVTTLSGDPNSAATLPFIPGSAIRGAMAARLIARGMDGESDEFRQLILSGDVRYLHAYPEIGGARTLPTPSSWRCEKGERDRAIDLADHSGAVDTSVDPEEFSKLWPEKALVGVTAPFAAASASSGDHQMVTPSIAARVHHQRDRVKGRAWKDSDERSHGAIFTYEYLEAEQVFRGVIQLIPAGLSQVELVQELLAAGPVLIGRSRRAGYGGKAEIELLEEAQHECDHVSGAISRDIQHGKPFRATLVSAYIGRDQATGQLDPTTLHQELCDRLGKDLVEIERTISTFQTVGAFNQKWRLEVPQAQAVAPGAVLVLRAKAPIPSATLRAIEHEGLGERRVEGFGRVLFLEHSEEGGDIRLTFPAPGRVEVKAREELSEKQHEQLAFLEQRIVLAAARKELDQIASADIASKAKKIPSNSLLGRIRTLFRCALDEKTARSALKNLEAWCGDGDNALKKKARQQLEDCRSLPNGNLLEWLKSIAAAHPKDGVTAWRTLTQAVGDSANRLNPVADKHRLSEKEQTAQAYLHAHAALLCVHLIDGFLAGLARRNRNKTEKTHG